MTKSLFSFLLPLRLSCSLAVALLARTINFRQAHQLLSIMPFKARFHAMSSRGFYRTAGFKNPEDLAVIPGGEFLLVSEMGAFMSDLPNTLSMLDITRGERVPIEINWEPREPRWVMRRVNLQKRLSLVLTVLTSLPEPMGAISCLLSIMVTSRLNFSN